MRDTTRMWVTVTERDGDWEVSCGLPGDTSYAFVRVPLTVGLDVALRSLVPYMAALTEPDPFTRLG